MTESEITGQDPDEFVNEALTTGYDAGREETLEQVEDFLEDEGFDPDDIEELLYDPAPRRRRRSRRASAAAPAAPKRRRTKHRSASSGRRGRRGGFKGGAKLKGMLGKFKAYAFPIAAGGSFIMQYAARADTLKAGGLITTGGYGGILEAIKYDLTNFNATDAMNRVSTNASTIAVPLVGGYLVKAVGGSFVKGGIEKDVVDIVGDLLMGYGVATGVKKVLDPPVNIPRQIINTTAQAIAPVETFKGWG